MILLNYFFNNLRKVDDWANSTLLIHPRWLPLLKQTKTNKNGKKSKTLEPIVFWNDFDFYLRSDHKQHVCVSNADPMFPFLFKMEKVSDQYPSQDTCNCACFPYFLCLKICIIWVKSLLKVLITAHCIFCENWHMNL